MQAGAGGSPHCKPRPAERARPPSFRSGDPAASRAHGLLAVSAMARWTRRQEQILRESGHMGAEAVRERIARECGVVHSVRAIEVRASRIRASLRVLDTCPECGAIGVTLNKRSGLCPLCTEQMHLREGMAFSEVLAREREARSEGAAIEEARRDRAKIRQQNHRLCEKHGLAGMRERKRGGGQCRCPGCELWPDCGGPGS